MQVLITTLRPIRNNVLDMTSIFLFEVDLIRVIRISNHFTTHFDSTHAHYFPLFLPIPTTSQLKRTTQTYPTRPKPPADLPRPIFRPHPLLKPKSSHKISANISPDLTQPNLTSGAGFLHNLPRHHTLLIFLKDLAALNDRHEFLREPDLALETSPDLRLCEYGGGAGRVYGGGVGEVDVHHFGDTGLGGRFVCWCEVGRVLLWSELVR
jgi:hypothetical protein